MRCGKYSFWGYILKVELTRFVDGLNVVLREKKVESEGFGLSTLEESVSMVSEMKDYRKGLLWDML